MENFCKSEKRKSENQKFSERGLTSTFHTNKPEPKCPHPPLPPNNSTHPKTMPQAASKKSLRSEGERIYQDYFGDFFLRVILRFIFHLETILKTIYSENSCQIENSPQNSLQTENEP